MTKKTLITEKVGHTTTLVLDNNLEGELSVSCSLQQDTGDVQESTLKIRKDSTGTIFTMSAKEGKDITLTIPPELEGFITAFLSAPNQRIPL